MQRRQLPEELGTSFTVREATRLGVPRDRLTAMDLRSPFHGTRTSVHLHTTADRCRAYEPRLTAAQFFSHQTAALLWGLPLPGPVPQHLHVSAMPPGREPRTRGVIGHRLEMSPDQLTLRHGLPVASPSETWAQLASTLGEDDLVAVGDAILTAGLADRADLVEASERPRRRGAKALAAAVPFLRAGAESPRESAVRLVLVRAGLPEPELNWVLRDAAGRFVARLDLAYPDYRVAVEYDGRQHADLEQFRRDADRWPAIAGQGWVLIRVLDHHLREPRGRVVEPTRKALQSRGWPCSPVVG
ncbi:endonuclease domain-containing protein [Microbacterium testaceum]|uniref:endonuclease domain-containing protein n=1 Tax=Microbacterium testaceum TaxID=2033 RepID=UPI0011AFCBD1|nr:DUF559 domain-containing protein [Microbacterium testaceum]